MSTTTQNLGLFKYDTTSDANVPFNITNALNNNWDTLDSAVNNAVKKSGDTMTGNLSISTNNPEIHITSTATDNSYGSAMRFYSSVMDDTSTTAPSDIIQSFNILGYDKNDHLLGGLTQIHNPSNNMYTGIYIQRKVNNTDYIDSIRIGVHANGQIYTYAPACGNQAHSILTNEGVSTATNGYMILGNGLIIQWGLISGEDSDVNTTQAFPYTFTTACRNVTVSPINTTTTWLPTSITPWIIGDLKKNGFEIRKKSDSKKVGAYWVAIGY